MGLLAMRQFILVMLLHFVIAHANAAPAGLQSLFAMDTSFGRLPGSIDAQLATVARLGYSGISYTGTDVAQIDSVVRAAQTNGLQLYALYVGCKLTSKSLDLPHNFETVCKSVATTDTIVWLYIESSEYSSASIDANVVAIPGLQNAAEVAAHHHVRLALYPHRGYWIDNFNNALRVANKVDRGNLGVSFNLCHSLAAVEEQSIMELLGLAGKKLFIVTLNGAEGGNAGAGWDRLIQAIGSGSYDLKPVVSFLASSGYKGPVGFQGFGIQGDQFEILSTSMDAWKQLNQ